MARAFGHHVSTIKMWCTYLRNITQRVVMENIEDRRDRVVQPLSIGLHLLSFEKRRGAAQPRGR